MHRMKPRILTVTLNPAIDKTVKVENFKFGQDSYEDAIFLSAGGKGLNVSRVLKRLGIESIATGFVGGASGDYIKKQLNKEKIKHDFCHIKKDTRTSLTVIDSYSKKITRLLERGPLVRNIDCQRFKKKYISLIKKCDYVIFSGKSIPGAPGSFYAQLISQAKKRNKFTVLDTSGMPYKLGLKQKPFMVKPNLKEAEFLIDNRLDSLKKIKQAVCLFHRRGIKIVAITLGSKGAVISDANEILFAVPPKIKQKNPVGCGDAFIGGFIALYGRDKNLLQAARMAVACAAANALSFNPGFINLGTVKKIINQIKIRKL